MGARAQIDFHERRPEIERDIALKVSRRVIAKRYGVSEDQVRWYSKNKMPPQLRATILAEHLGRAEDLDRLREEESTKLLVNLSSQRARLLLMQDQALQDKDAKAVAALAAQIHKNISLVGSYLGEFSEVSTKISFNVLVSDEYLQLRSGLIRALMDHPKAKKAVLSVFREIEEKAAHQPKMIEGKTVEVWDG